MSCIDRVLCNTEFEAPFPLAIARALNRSPSDHVPILWESGHGQEKKAFRFKIEKWWLHHKEFEELMNKVWTTKVEGGRAIDRWQNKTRLLRKKAKGWNANAEAEISMGKKVISKQHNKLDVKAKSNTLTA
jgi:hypothetical protein